MNTSREAIGELIRRMRESKGLSQTELANLLGKDRQYIWKLENGYVNVTPNYLDGIIKVLASTPVEFFNLQEQETQTNVL